MTTTSSGDNSFWYKILAVIVVLIFVFMQGWLASKRHYEGDTYTKTVIDTVRVTVYDTVRVTQPFPKDSIIIRYETIPVFVADTITDTIFYDLPIEQKVYGDSVYTAWISGFHPNLDSIYIRRRTEYQTIYKTNTIYKKTKRWGVGLQAGYGYSHNEFNPYIGIGVSYNVFSW